MPKARQRYLLAKLTSMKRLKVFLDVSESSRLILKPLQNELYQEILPNITFEDKRILLDHSILSFFIQRLENCRLSLVREPIIYVEGADQELLENYIKYSITGKPALKTAYDQGMVLRSLEFVGAFIKWGASFRWSSSLYCPMRNLAQMAKTHPTLRYDLGTYQSYKN